MQPTSFKIKPAGSDRFEPTKLLTRNTYSLDQASVSGHEVPDLGGVPC